MKLVHIARALLILVVAAVAAVYLPYYYWMAFDVNVRTPLVTYSPVLDRFLFTRPTGKEVLYTDAGGRTYTREEYERMAPLANYRQLASSGSMPDSLRGVKLEMKQVSLNNIFTRIQPADLDKPQIQLFPMFESRSGRVKIEMPAEMFRIGPEMEFITAETNRKNADLSERFTRALQTAGFSFPARVIAGNPTTRKPFDEGYFVVDAANHVFHIKMVKGQPYCVNIGVPDSVRVRALIVQEMQLREFYGWLIAEDNAVYLISYDRYRLIRLPLEGYDASRTQLLFAGDLFFRTMTVSSLSGLNTVATDRSYAVIDRHAETWPSRYDRMAGVLASYVFPFMVSLTDRSSSYVDTYVRWSGITGLVGIVLSVLLLVLVLKLRRKTLASRWFDVLVVACSGVFGLIAVLLIDGVDERG